MRRGTLFASRPSEDGLLASTSSLGFSVQQQVQVLDIEVQNESSKTLWNSLIGDLSNHEQRVIVTD
ncbi:uncharacterized protein RCO7_08926 [Rhynchosporium graminicola]|uniref:Uncharacterized protein n=2 Tax=Rhynchosporium TaxID=38037 RepID=A0A1E1MNN7_RHYSE|nr:uncharacterized protein RCO7_08926 [Rhynchosporium commune]CZT50710.1 uncharacterized protein RSE6_11746 [Rhynchosporium secalis]